MEERGSEMEDRRSGSGQGGQIVDKRTREEYNRQK
jgi:hypothetical protein